MTRPAGRALVAAWREMDERQRFAWNKLITGEFRVGVSQSLVVRALAEASGHSTEAVAHRLMGDWQPTPEFWARLMAAESESPDLSRPYPFCLAYPLEGAVEELGRAARVAGGMEMGRHPRPIDPARRGRRSCGRAARN